MSGSQVSCSATVPTKPPIKASTPSGWPINAPKIIPRSIGMPHMKWVSQVIETGFKQDLQYVDGKGPRNTFLSFDIAAFPQWGQVSAIAMDLSDLGTACGVLLMRPNA